MVEISTIINNQYPHHLYVLSCNEDAEQDANGSWQSTDTDATAKYIGVCRDETNGRSTEENVAQATYRDFKSLIQLPVDTEHITEGTEIVVTDEKIEAEKLLNSEYVAEARQSGLIRITGVVSKFDKGRLHCRIWI